VNDGDLQELYRDIILEHYHYPRGHKHVDAPDIHNEGKNPVCGDEIELEVKLNGDVVEQVGVHCVGCAISVASGSMLSEIVEGKSIGEVKRIAQVVKAMLTGGDLPEGVDPADLGDLEVLQGVRNFPVRIKCALLAWTTLVEGLENYESGNGAAQVETAATEQ